jgi:type 1 glutamine amidotransferase
MPALADWSAFAGRSLRLLAAVGCLTATAWGTTAGAAGAAQKRVLLVTEARGFVHDSIPAAEAFFEGLGRRSRRFDVIRVATAADLTPGRLRNADGVVFANTSGELPLPSRRALTRFVRRGGAFVGTHSASDTLHSWGGYERLLGGEFMRHGAVEPGRLVVSHRAHAITRGLPRSFELTDEFYEFVHPVPAHTRVLVRLAAASVPDEQGTRLPLVWARRYGEGRVFYNALGHRVETWLARPFRQLTARGLRWALGAGG